MGLITRKKAIIMSSPHIETVRSGDSSDSEVIATFKTDMKVPIASLKVNFSPVQSGSGDPSPTNVRPITGHTGLTVKRAGVNLLQCDTFANGTTRGVTFTGTRNSDGEVEAIKISGTATGNNLFKNLNYVNSSTNKWPLDGAYATYSYSDYSDIRFVANSNNPKDRDGDTVRYVEKKKWRIWDIDNTGRTGAWVRIDGLPYYTSGKTFNTIVYPMMCLAQDVGCEFEPYKGVNIPVSWQSEAGTLYGGYVDLVSGELVQEWANIASYNGELLPGEWVSSKDTYAQGTLPTTGAQVVYKLASPIVLQLTPQKIRTFSGRNNIWSDTGNVEVKYWTH